MNNSDFDFDDTKQWAIQQWGRACLGDKRRTRRAVQLGAVLAQQPAASLPSQTQSWSELKAAYRLLQEGDVTHSALSRPHWELTREKALNCGAGVVLYIQDTTELDYTQHQRTSGLGRIGDDQGRGLLAHSCLAVVPSETTPQILGMAAQSVWTRPAQPFKGHETRAQRAARDKESDVWAEVVEQIGAAPAGGSQFVSVGDRASDIFSYVRRARATAWHVLLRVTQNRVITRPDGRPDKLLDYVRRLPATARQRVELRGRDGKPKRRVEFQVADSEVLLCAPQTGPERKPPPIRGWVVRCWAEAEIEGEAIEWVLFTTLAVKEERANLEVVQWYSHRWVIEEYHKCLKTGCAIEQRQLQSAEGLKRLLGFLAIVAIRLLQLREMSRREPDAKATTQVEELLVRVVLQKLGLRGEADHITLREFWRGVARLGGFIGRKSDGDPGWQTLWRGWQRLQDLAWGLQTTT